MAPPKHYRSIKPVYSVWRSKLDELKARETEFYRLKAEIFDVEKAIVEGGQPATADQKEWLEKANASLPIHASLLATDRASFEEETTHLHHMVQQFKPNETGYIKLNDKEDIMCVHYLWFNCPATEIFCAAERGLPNYKLDILKAAFRDWIGIHLQYHHLYILRKPPTGPGTGTFDGHRVEVATPEEENNRRFNPSQ